MTIHTRKDPVAVLRDMLAPDTVSGRWFRARILQACAAVVHADFIAKSTGSTDSQGIRWKPLTPEYLRSLDNRTLRRSPLTRKALSSMAKQQRAAERATLSLFPILQSGFTGATAQSVQHSNTGEHPIGIRNGRLLISLAPGIVSGGNYYAPNEQIAEILGRNIRFGTRVPYAKHFHRARPIFDIPKLRERLRQAAIEALRDGLIEGLQA